MLQNHLFQLLTITAMEPPRLARRPVPSATKKVKVPSLHSHAHPRFPSRRNVVRAQYGGGYVQRTRPSPPIARRKKVRPTTPLTEDVSSAVKFEIDNWRWHGRPPSISAPARPLETQFTEINIVFKRPPGRPSSPPTATTSSAATRCAFASSPTRASASSFNAKVPRPRRDRARGNGLPLSRRLRPVPAGGLRAPPRRRPRRRIDPLHPRRRSRGSPGASSTRSTRSGISRRFATLPLYACGSMGPGRVGPVAPARRPVLDQSPRDSK